MNRTLLATAICAGLFATGAVCAQPARAAQPNPASPQDQNAADQSGQATTTDKKKKEKTLQTVTVTGSLIPQSQIETASPVIKISAKDLETQGFRNVYEALKAQPIATGAVQNDSQGGTFTQAAHSLSLFGLDPGFTLVLINGHPMANYPIAYNGSGGNFADLSNIPVAMVDHIDILSGGQSSLYGSSAIAGVVNIVLKQHIEGFNLAFRAGGFTEGGGQSQRLTATGGWNSGKFNLTYGLQLATQHPVWYFQRPYAASYLANPTGTPDAASRTFLQTGLLDPSGYIDPGAATCAPLHYLFGNSTGYDYRAKHGYYCGSYNETGYGTMLNKSTTADGYVNATYQFNDNTQAYAEILYGLSKPVFNSGSQFWTYYNPELANSANSYASYFWNNTTQNIELWQHIIAPEEMGSIGTNNDKILTKQYNVNLGLRGNIGASNWAYDGYYNRSQVSTAENQLWPLNAPFINYYLGQQQGTDPLGYGFPAFTPNQQRFYTPLTPAQYRAMSANLGVSSISWQQNLTGIFTNTDLFELPAGAVGFAGVLQYGNQAINNPVSPGIADNLFAGRTGSTEAGSRKHAAVGAELRVPIFKMLTADMSARYDRYDSGFRTDAKPTYKLGLEFRPFDTLLLRATYATAFRAPDLDYLFAKNSGFYQPGVVDYYRCRLNNPGFTQPSQCDSGYSGEVFGHANGTPDLKDVTSKSFGYGVVWSPTSKFNLKVDYQHIRINNEIETQSYDDLMETEADCRLGKSFGGQVYDINSPTCVDALSRVTRFPANSPFALAANTVQYISLSPVNIASEWVDGIQASLNYSLDAGRIGTFNFGLSYYDELHHKSRSKPGDPEIDLLHNFNSYEYKTITAGSLGWSIGPWSTTLYTTLYGATVNAGGTGVTGSYALTNANVRYDLAADDAYIQVTANNLFDRHPPVDASNGWPYYNNYVYSGLGRAVFVEFGIHLGAGKAP